MEYIVDPQKLLVDIVVGFGDSGFLKYSVERLGFADIGFIFAGHIGEFLVVVVVVVVVASGRHVDRVGKETVD